MNSHVFFYSSTSVVLLGVMFISSFENFNLICGIEARSVAIFKDCALLGALVFIYNL